MSNSNQHDQSSGGEAMEAAFAEIPLIPSTSTWTRPPTRRVWFVVVASIVLIVAGTALAYLSHPTNHVDSNTPRVVVVVSGMTCPLQCGVRMASAIESLPWVIPDSVRANTESGIVIFAVTSADAVDQEALRRVIQRAGFGVKSIQMLDDSPLVEAQPGT